MRVGLRLLNDTKPLGCCQNERIGLCIAPKRSLYNEMEIVIDLRSIIIWFEVVQMRSLVGYSSYLHE
jgi:hypothetical protein